MKHYRLISLGLLLMAFVLAGAFTSNQSGNSSGLQDYMTAKEFFPLEPGTTWTYEDSNLVGRKIVDKAIQPDLAPGENPYGVIVEYVDGQRSGEQFYQIHGDRVNLIGRGKLDVFAPRPILVVGGTNDWDYYADPVTPYSSKVIHVTAHSVVGTPQILFGHLRRIVVVTDVATAGGKNGLNVQQSATYAEGVGLIKFTESGTAGKGKIQNERTLIAFHPSPDLKIDQSKGS